MSTNDPSPRPPFSCEAPTDDDVLLIDLTLDKRKMAQEIIALRKRVTELERRSLTGEP